MFRPVDSKLDVPALERGIISFWRTNDIESKYLHRNEQSSERFSFLDGPITANGRMGVHHAWGRTYKDVWQRYHTMLGHRQRYQNGFDCQGLWVEVTVERELGFRSKRDIEEYGIAEFVRKCKESVFSFAAQITAQSQRLGMFMDWENSYYTLSDENNYTIWLFLKTCHEQGWLYKGHDSMPWCVRCGTGLSEHEINTTDYEELTHTSVYVKLPLVDRPGESLLIWTTTPWTLTSNVAAAVNSGKDPVSREPVRYVRAKYQGEIVYLAREALRSIDPQGSQFEIESELAGGDMLNWRYRGPFDELPAQQGIEHRVIAWDDVSASEGTGIVHIAPGAGKEDFALGKEYSLPAVAPLDDSGVYIEGFDWLTGRNVLDVSTDIVENLRQKKILFRAHEYTHRYPVCWRCQTQLVFRLVDEWFISMDDLRVRMMAATENINWIPPWGLERELDWLRNMSDWMISKKRYWGLALPIFECGCGHVEVIGGKEELLTRAVSGLDNLESPHRPWLDGVRIACPACGELVPRIKEVGNPWLDAGIVPFSTLKYVADREYWRDWFPAQFITESFPGQFRNWFYSMIAQSAALENTNPYETVLGYALLRDSNGREMHKSWGNAIDFDEAAEKAGADTMRWLFVNHQPENNLNFGFPLLDDVTSRFLILWNTYSFFVTYANIDRFDPSESLPHQTRALLDRWIMARLNQVIGRVRAALDRFDCQDGGRAIDEFIEDLSTWYVRRSRRRFWKSGTAGDDLEKRSAYVTLYECLRTLTLLMAPFVPFLSEHLYQNLVADTAAEVPESVHLCDFPRVDESVLDVSLLTSMETARKLVSLARAARDQAQIRVRQPLACLYVALPAGEFESIHGELAETIMDELNVKRIEEAPADARFVEYRVRPNLPVLGKRYGRDVQDIRAGLSSLPAAEVATSVHAGEPVQVHHESRHWTLQPDEILVEAVKREGFTAAAEGGYLAALDTTITPELRHEGLAREFARSVNEARRAAGFDLSDRITVRYAGASPEFVAALNSFGDFIARETLAEAIIAHEDWPEDTRRTVESDGESVRFAVSR